jgi:transposase
MWRQKCFRSSRRSGGFDVHRKQITFDYVDDDGLVRVGEIRPATRTTLRHWLSEHCPAGDAEFALEGCTGWRYVVDELATAGVVAHLGDPAEIATLRGPKKRAKTDRADARLLRTLLLEGRFRSRGSRRLMWWRCAPWAGCTAR